MDGYIGTLLREFDVTSGGGKRELVIYGAGLASHNIFRELTNFELKVSCFADTRFVELLPMYGKPIISPEMLDSKKHYVLIGGLNFIDEMSAFLERKGFSFVNDYVHCLHRGKEDFMFKNCRIGGYTDGFSAFLGSISAKQVHSIGRFTSINATAKIQGNHRMGLSLSSAVYSVDAQNEKFYREKYLPEPEPPLIRPKINAWQPVTIGNDVWIGANAFINVAKVKSIGDGAIIGTGAIVLEDVPPYAIIIGAPAKIKRFRFSEIQIETLLRVQWWNWDEDTMRENSEMFYNEELFFERFGGV